MLASPPALSPTSGWKAVVAALLVDSEAIYHVSPILKPEDFFREKNGWVYEACLDLWNRDEAINQIHWATTRRRDIPALMALAIAAMTVMVRRHRNTPMIAAAALSTVIAIGLLTAVTGL